MPQDAPKDRIEIFNMDQSTGRVNLKQLMEEFGPVQGCHIGRRGFDNPIVRYADPAHAELAMQALKGGRVCLQGFILTGEWRANARVAKDDPADEPQPTMRDLLGVQDRPRNNALRDRDEPQSMRALALRDHEPHGRRRNRSPSNRRTRDHAGTTMRDLAGGGERASPSRSRSRRRHRHRSDRHRRSDDRDDQIAVDRRSERGNAPMRSGQQFDKAAPSLRELVMGRSPSRGQRARDKQRGRRDEDSDRPEFTAQRKIPAPLLRDLISKPKESSRRSATGDGESKRGHARLPALDRREKVVDDGYGEAEDVRIDPSDV